MKQLHGSEELSLTVVVWMPQNRRLKSPKKQHLYYSGKKKHHSLKAQIVIAWQWAQIICCDCEKGSTHDFKLLKKSRVHFQQGQLCLADAGYQGLHKRHQRSHTPHKKPKGAEQKQENQLLAAQRIIIEMVFRMLKRFRILSSRYRNRRRRWGLRLNLIAGLYNFELLQPFARGQLFIDNAGLLKRCSKIVKLVATILSLVGSTYPDFRLYFYWS
nr:transposase family protein [[Leptolyngbya] sp. PCC 7376]